MELPARYGHYLLLERIAVGGMGEIFRAKYAGLAGFERPCAIKRILPHLSDDEEFADRLIHEAKVAVQLTHANIVQIFELGKIEKEYFIAMEWVDGPDLSTLQVRAKAKDLPMPIALSIHVVHEVARALDHAHRKADADGKPLGIVHRDVSPQNVMISVDGAVKLGDFGIARAGGIARQFATNAGAVLGKRRYMSPEQRRGEAVDGRADVYALGAILYELIAGEPPDPDSEFVPLAVRIPELPDGLDDLTTKALQWDPAQRLPGAQALVEGLERVFMRMAAVPGAIRDPSIELGRYVQKVCPPGEKRPQRRSLTARMRDAMRPGLGEKSAASMPESTAAVAVRPESSISGDSMPLGAIAAAEGTASGSVVEPTSTGIFVRTPATEEEDDDAPPREDTEAEAAVPEPPEPPQAARDGGGVTLVVSTVMLPPQKVAVPAAGAANETIIRPRPIAPTPGPTKVRERPPDVTVAVPPREKTAVVERLFPDAPAPRRARGRAWLAIPLLGVVVAGGAWLATHRPPAFVADAAATPAPEATRAHAIAARTPASTPVALRTPAPTPAPVVATPAPTPRPRATRVAAAGTPRPRPTPRQVAAAPAEATLVLGAIPWANMSVDGKSAGSLSTQVKVSAGEPHTIVFEHPKFGKRVRTITPRPGETERVVVDFKNPE